MKARKWFVLLVSSIGGLLLSLTGLSIGWMLGTLFAAACLSFAFPKRSEEELPKGWLYTGQLILGIELGQKINLSVLTVFQSHWFVIMLMMGLSVLFSLLSGVILWRFSRSDMLTSFFGTAPGGLSAMPALAEEVGANTAVVSIIQTMRVFLVILLIPVLVSLWTVHPSAGAAVQPAAAFEPVQLLWTAFLIFAGWSGYYAGKYLRFPAPWLLGSMTAVALVQSLASSLAGQDMIAYWPHSLIVLSQVLIAVSIGSRFHKKMFSGLHQILAVGLISTVGLIAVMFICAYFVSFLTGIDFKTAALAFAPGGIAEMATTAVVLEADSTFVVAVQVLRILAVCLILPPLFRLLHARELRKDAHTRASA
ncbi:AbrB family transcriptional regulator [Bacillus badius]|uniref:AbrB family transcriptional regulator n=1 Tax=Bacillus badius TaxID=1455 RepID=UPI000597BB53|nr:AbrB family transcriptional regulator [Bacillus badius]KIL74529.1 putative ammonia monooxygenase [Bacillus badius]